MERAGSLVDGKGKPTLAGWNEWIFQRHMSTCPLAVGATKLALIRMDCSAQALSTAQGLGIGSVHVITVRIPT